MNTKITKRKTALKQHRPFQPIIDLIRQARARSFRAVNTELIALYWNIGKFISLRILSDGWGKATVQSLASYIEKNEPHTSGFSSQNLWRMRQFYETYRTKKKLSPLVRELSWSHNLLILGKCTNPDEREFYLRHSLRERWGKRELERQIDGGLFERTILSKPKLSPVMRELHPNAEEVFAHYGLATMCIGVGQGVAVVVERI